MTDKTYNGWANYETWLIALWIDNEQGSYDYWREQAEAARTEYALANQLKDEFGEAVPQLEGFWADLMGAALSEVDWREVAKHYWEETHSEESEAE